MTGRLSFQTEDWGVVLRNGAGADNAQPQSGVGSAYVNDVYIRSIGKWASQLNPQISFFTASNSSINLGRFTFCSLGYVGDSQGGTSWFSVYPTDNPDSLGKRNWVLYVAGGVSNNSATANCF